MAMPKSLSFKYKNKKSLEWDDVAKEVDSLTVRDFLRWFSLKITS